MIDTFQSSAHWRSLLILILSLRSLPCLEAVQSAVERAKAISSAVSVSASKPGSTYFEASRDAEDVLADQRYSLLIDRILESDDKSDVARGKIGSTDHGMFLIGHGMTPRLMTKLLLPQGYNTSSELSRIWTTGCIHHLGKQPGSLAVMR